MGLADLAPCAVPAKVSLPARHAQFVDIAHADLGIPSFDYAIARLSGRCEIDLGSLLQLAAEEQLGSPRGFIFHTTRCGSTLVANMLGAHQAFRVVKEPNAINQFLLQQREYLADAGKDAEKDDWFRALTSSYGRGLTKDQGVVVKFSGWTMPFAEYVVRQFPHVPVIFIWRRAEAVVMSCVAQQPGWTELREDSSLGRELFGEYKDDAALPQELSRVAFYARAWLSFAGHGMELARRHPDQVTMVNYDDMTRSYSEFIAAAATKFGLTATASDLQLMLSVTAAYSKSFRKDVRFDPLGAHARPHLSAAARDVVGWICGAREAALLSATRPVSPYPG